MYKTIATLFLCFLVSLQLNSQILPQEGSMLNYRLIGFAFTAEREAKSYKIEIAEGSYNSEDLFKKNIVQTINGAEHKRIVEVPLFGTSYTWRSSWVNNKSVVTKSPLHHFSTTIIPEVDSSKTRFRLLQQAEKYGDAYLFLDGTKALYDMKGKPVWYLPNKEIVTTAADLKLSPKGTITFLFNEQAYEINYNGDILWQGPKNGTVCGDTSEHYHHEFTRLSNGHYMVMGSESVVWIRPLLPANDQRPSLMPPDRAMPAGNGKTLFGTIIEYDERGNVVWSWKSSGYFMNSDLQYYTPPGPMGIVDVHENAFYFDEKERAIYVSCKDIDRIVKVKYPEGTVLNSYGEIYRQGVAAKGNPLFCGQHCCRNSGEGYLYLYNNNSCDEVNSIPKIVLLEQPLTPKDTLKKVWEYQCTTEGLNVEKMKGPEGNLRMQPPGMKAFRQPRGGGSVTELPDHSFFVSMSGPYGKIFIVNRNKKTLWSAVPEKWNEEERKWKVVAMYRASIIVDRKELERMIWNCEKNQ
jgi:Arylsulfotransferase (ASST)